MRRVHVGAVGAVTPFGSGASVLCDAVFAGRSALRPLDRLAGTDCLTSVAAEMPDAHPEKMARAVMEQVGEADAFILATTKADLSGIVGPGDGLGNPGRLARRLFDSQPLAAVSCACASGL